ncbi:flagellar biosynthetic protein FliO [Sulfurivirga sp.]|uniref:flagellar biosynthetic protein FliO n=1 Tax=Sulfurivirga sp. TaxID=2614236 RepID=UPI0025DE179A|nr:flagellar biosynthetic protein FliO [Sulfurivirga sp.]
MLMLFPALAQAQEEVGARAFHAADYLGQVVFSLLLVIALILVAAWLLRRFTQLPGAQGQAVRVLSAVAVGRQEKILLLEVGGEQILVGVTPSRISTLHVLAEPLAVPDNAEKNSTGFPKWLQHAVEQYGRERPDTPKEN